MLSALPLIPHLHAARVLATLHTLMAHPGWTTSCSQRRGHGWLHCIWAACLTAIYRRLQAISSSAHLNPVPPLPSPAADQEPRWLPVRGQAKSVQEFSHGLLPHQLLKRTRANQLTLAPASLPCCFSSFPLQGVGLPAQGQGHAHGRWASGETGSASWPQACSPQCGHDKLLTQQQPSLSAVSQGWLALVVVARSVCTARRAAPLQWDYNEAFGLCCGYPIDGWQRGGQSGPGEPALSGLGGPDECFLGFAAQDFCTCCRCIDSRAPGSSHCRPLWRLCHLPAGLALHDLR